MFGEKRGIDLASFVGGIVRALTKGQQSLVKARREQISKHFEENDDGVMVPKVKKFKVGEDQILPVPTFCFSRVNSIGIDAAKITCSAKLVEFKKEDMECELADHDQQVKYIVVPAKNGRGDFEIDIKFGRKTDCEAEDRLNEYLTGLMEVESQVTNLTGTTLET